MSDRWLNAVYCDDVREEAGNKQSWMGIYSGELIVPQLPVLLPKICICLSLMMREVSKPSSIRFFVKVNEKIEADMTLGLAELTDASAGKDPAPVERNKWLNWGTVMQFSPFHVEKETVLQAFAEVDGETLKARKFVMRAAKPEEFAALGQYHFLPPQQLTPTSPVLGSEPLGLLGGSASLAG